MILSFLESFHRRLRQKQVDSWINNGNFYKSCQWIESIKIAILKAFLLLVRNEKSGKVDENKCETKGAKKAKK